VVAVVVGAAVVAVVVGAAVVAAVTVVVGNVVEFWAVVAVVSVTPAVVAVVSVTLAVVVDEAGIVVPEVVTVASSGPQAARLAVSRVRSRISVIQNRKRWLIVPRIFSIRTAPLSVRTGKLAFNNFPRRLILLATKRIRRP
jgi:hypothetical protein